jgi:hypothetical protein
MTSNFKTICAGIAATLLVAGCASQPIPFQLIDSESGINTGTIFPDGQRIEAIIEGQSYKGFYIVASQVAYSETFGGWRYGPHDTVTTSSSNSGRAQLTSDKGQHLSCEFLFESKRAIGACRSPAGKVFQLTADGIPH